jgi:uncharacterized protein
MKTDNQRRSDNFEDRGRGGSGGGGRGRGGGGVGAQALFSVVRRLGFRGTVIAAIPVGLLLLLNPCNVRSVALSMLFGEVPTMDPTASTGPVGAKVCDTQAAACDFSARILGATEDVWNEQFQLGHLPAYGVTVTAYQEPTLVVFTDHVDTSCGNTPSSVGPFYCPADRKLYIDPSFYAVMAGRLKAPGDFAQAYVIGHEVGHHIQNLIGANRIKVEGETDNQTSVRAELQADCFSGVWANRKRDELHVDNSDVAEALTAAHAIGDDTLGNGDAKNFTHGTSAQRMTWFRRGYETGDARQCDTFAEQDYRRL